VDTDVCIEVLRRRRPDLHARFASHDADLAVSSLTVSELHFGAARSSDPRHNARAVEEFLGFLHVLAFSAADAQSAGQVRAELARVGMPIGAYDVLIAGQARARSLVLVTGNLTEFRRVDGLRVEDWLQR
jgi:tRNA(fMet)-specific endonuclease VapC